MVQARRQRCGCSLGSHIRRSAARLFSVTTVVRNVLDVRRVSGYLPGAYALPPEMSARQFLQYIAAMFALPREVASKRTEALLERFGLSSEAGRKLRGFSTGMTQKVGLAQAMINEPRVLFLDEPTTRLDPV